MGTVPGSRDSARSTSPQGFDGFRSASSGSETGPTGPNGDFVQRLAQGYTDDSSTSTSPDNGRSMDSHRVSARWLRGVTFALVFFALAGLLGCGSSGGGASTGASANTAADVPLVVDPIFLTPGETQAQLAWVASEGPVDFGNEV